MTLVVLGWDGLDADLLADFGLDNRFGTATQRLETFANPELGKPHTFELWPSMITGLRPNEHGIHANEFLDGGRFESSVLDVAARISKYTVPSSLRWAVGRKLRSAGMSFEFESLDYFRDRGLWTVFDDRHALPLAIPNARSEYDDQLGIQVDRGAALAEHLDVKTTADGETIHRPSVDLETLRIRLESDVGHKLGAVNAGLEWNFDLIFVWLSFIDTIGHVAPTVDESREWVRSGYETAAHYTKSIKNQLEPTDDLICVSDHGLKGGHHTDAAFFGSWQSDAADVPADVCEVAQTIDSIAPSSRPREQPHSASQQPSEITAVRDNLKQLGYIE